MEANALFDAGKVAYAQGNLDDAAACFEGSLARAPRSAESYDNLLVTINYLPDYSRGAIFEMHRDFDTRFGQPLARAAMLHTNSVDRDRRLRVGYVSPDFKAHSVAFFVTPVLRHHDHDRFEVFGYHNSRHSDGVTEALRHECDHWREIASLTDEEVAGIIRRDEVDILVDLTGHTAFNRLLTFARKPAPVQVTWLGYPNTTGLAAIDYRVTDDWTDPPGDADRYYTERLIRLPTTFSCYSPPGDCPEVSPLPVATNGFVTFGSLNNFSKIHPEVVGVWIRLLEAVPQSRLILVYNGGSKSWLDNIIHRVRSSAEIPFAALRAMSNLRLARKAFATSGISASRIKILRGSPSSVVHLQNYQKIDIALDPFPYNGTTTTCESLWMGLPVIALEGDTHAQRVSSGILNNVGLGELSARSHEEYLAIARRLSEDKRNLAALRATLRPMMSGSSLMDGREFTANLESAYRSMWEEWSSKQRSSRQ